MLTSLYTNSNSLNLELSRFHTEFQLSQFHTEFQLSQTLSIPIFLSFYTFMANPSGATVQSSMGENLEIAKILETTVVQKHGFILICVLW